MGTTENSSIDQKPGSPGGRGAWSTSLTHRTASARPIAVLVWICLGACLGWLLFTGETRDGVDAAPWLFFVSWFIYCTQWRPCLRTGTDGYELVNVIRDHRIPFTAVEDIQVRYTVTIRAAGKRYISWGAPTPPSAFGAGFGHVSDVKSRHISALPSNERISQPETRTGRDTIVAAWQDGLPAALTHPAGGVVSTWNRPAIVIGAIAFAWVLITVLV